jgi:hypothetical protein
VSQLSDTFAEVRARLDQIGLQAPVVPLAMRDQIGAAFRADLVSLGIDTGADGALNAAIAGMAVGLKMLIQQGASPPLLGHYVWVCECLVPMIDTPQSDLTGFDMDFLSSLNLKPIEEPLRFACSRCGGPDAIVPAGAIHLCVTCAGDAVVGGLAALRLSGGGMPKVGGPEFERPPESAHTEEGVPQAESSTGHAKALPIEGAEATTGGTVDTPLSQSWWVNPPLGGLLRKLFGSHKRQTKGN